MHLRTTPSCAPVCPSPTASVPLALGCAGLGLRWAVVAMIAVVFPAVADDWPQWLGPQRDAVWRETGIMESFPEGGPPLRWKTQIGSGYSGPGGKRQLIIWHGEAINALNPETGAVSWSVPLRPTYGMAIAPPVAEGNSIFIMSYSRKSWCLRVADDGLSAKISWQGNTRRGIDGAINMPFIQDGRIYGCGNT